MKDDCYEAWQSRRLYMECSECGYARTYEQGEVVRKDTADCDAFRYVLGTVIERCDVKRPDRFGFITDFTYAPGHDREFQA